jgi:hypothetical protein
MIAHAPATSLQQLVTEHGSYDAITERAWQRSDAGMTRWRDRQRLGADYHYQGLSR